MAIWQFEVSFIPENIDYSVLQTRESSVEQDNFVFPESIIDAFNENFDRSDSWDEFHVLMWGNENGNRIVTIVENSVICEISVRIDVRELDTFFINVVVDIAQRFDCKLLMETGEVINPDVNGIMQKLHDSSAYSFVKNPRVFLDKISKGNDHDQE